VESIQATRESVWDFVMDPTRIGYCGPGVERVDLIDDGRFTAIAKVGIGVISARFHIDADMSTLKPGEEATVSVRAKAAGSAVEGVGRIKLLDSANNDGVAGRCEPCRALGQPGRPPHRGRRR
jgi:carbon monoxide dehydrogenase subunit G